MKILIVDDSMAMRRIIRKTLRQAGYENHEYVEAENGSVALQIVKTTPPDLILCDWNMPEMSGIDFLAAIRADGKSIPFGFITSEGTDAMRQKAQETGANFLLAKPFTPDQMANALKDFLK